MRRTQSVLRGALAVATIASTLVIGSSGTAEAASSNGCTDSGFTIVNLTTGATVATASKDRIRTTLPASQFGDRFAIRGHYTQFEVTANDFAVYNQAFTGAANPLDQTGGRFTPVFASKIPDHRGLTLTSGIAIELRDEDLSLQRTGTTGGRLRSAAHRSATARSRCWAWCGTACRTS